MQLLRTTLILLIADIQAQIDSTVDIMHQNITKVAERGERLDNLQDKTGELSISNLPLISQTTSRSQLKDSAVVPTASGSKCGGRT